MAEELQQACLNILKSLGKTMGLITLYQVNHPTVVRSLEETYQLIEDSLDEVEADELVFAIEGDKFLANGKVVCALSQIPGAIRTLFNRYRLHSLTFAKGLSVAELSSFYGLVTLKPEVAKQINVKDFLRENSISHIRTNEAIYAKVEKKSDEPVLETGSQPAPSKISGSSNGKWFQELEELPFEKSVEKLVQKAVEGEQDRKQVYEKVLAQFRREVEGRIQEVTKTFQREKTKLTNEQVRTDQVLTKIAEGVVVVDNQGNVLMMNPTAEEITGKRLAEAAGKPVMQGVKKDEQMVTLSKEIEAPSDRPISKEVQVASEDELAQALRAATALVQTESGKLVGTYMTLPDVAKYKQVLNLQQDFIAHVTHELRAPLTSIRSALDMLKEQFTGKMGSDETRVFSTAIRNSERLATLINDILDFSKIQSGQMNVYPVPSQVSALIQEGVEGLRAWGKKKGLNMLDSVEPNLPMVLADGRRVVQILTNLISNGIKFTPAGGTIAIAARRGEGKYRGFAVFSVQDTGRGIPKEELRRVFEKFVQIASGEKHVEGTGLGLAIAQALVHLHKGLMWVDSEEGKGSIFYFTLPYYVPPPEEKVEKAHPPAAKKSWWRRFFG
ncbi:MAG: PAS domain S-box protein [Elusimicrobia bacterium]|nr:PAS domain S-box protein [Elusimicrobiota bacterium]